MRWEISGRPGAIQRAFELARSGECSSIRDLRDRLTAEGFSASQLEGPTLIRQLREVLRGAKSAAIPAEE